MTSPQRGREGVPPQSRFTTYTYLVTWADKGREGVINSEKWANVVYGWPLAYPSHFPNRMSMTIGYSIDFLILHFVVKTLKPNRHSVTICTPYCTRHYWLPGFSLQLISCLILFDRFSMEPKVSVLTQKSTICIFQDKWKSNVLTAKKKLEILQFSTSS